MGKAVLLVSGADFPDEALTWAESLDYDVYPLVVDYGQSQEEFEDDLEIASHADNSYACLVCNLSAITEISVNVYIPARNLILLSLALSYAESIGAWDIFFGTCKSENPFPDVTSKFCRAFEGVAQKCTEAGRRGKRFRLHTFSKMIPDEVKAFIEELENAK